MIRVIGWETTQEAIDRNVADSRRKAEQIKKNPIVKKFESVHTEMRAKLNRKIEKKIAKKWLEEVSGDII